MAANDGRKVGCFLTILTAHFRNAVRSVERQRCTLLLTSAIAASGSSVHSLAYSNKSFHTDSGTAACFFTRALRVLRWMSCGVGCVAVASAVAAVVIVSPPRKWTCVSRGTQALFLCRCSRDWLRLDFFCFTSRRLRSLAVTSLCQPTHGFGHAILLRAPTPLIKHIARYSEESQWPESLVTVVTMFELGLRIIRLVGKYTQTRVRSIEQVCAPTAKRKLWIPDLQPLRATPALSMGWAERSSRLIPTGRSGGGGLG